MSDLHPADPGPANHCECGLPMVVLLDDEGLFRGGHHTTDTVTEEIWPGLGPALDQHHRAMLCGHCDGTDSYDVEYHHPRAPATD